MEKSNNQRFKTHISSEHRLVDLHLKETLSYIDLIKLFVKRDFVSKYKQTVLGPAWALIQPLLTTFVYTLVFGGLAGLTTSDVEGDYVLPGFLFYLSGSICWSYFSGTLSATSGTFINNSSVMGKVYYPRLVTPIATAFSQLISFFIQFAMLLVAMIIYGLVGGTSLRLTPMLILLPLIMLQMMILATGFGIIISSVTTKFRDLQMLVGFGLQLWQYATPIAYGLTLVSSSERFSKYMFLYQLNPMTPIVTTFRYALFGFGYFNLKYYIISWVVTLIVFIVGLILFSKIERTFMDTICEENTMSELMIKVENVAKQYKLGQIGGTTLREELQRKAAKLMKKEDPTKKIGHENEEFGKEFLALSGLSFDVKKGEAVGIIGHNGAGKSTLLKLITRITAPSEGDIYLNGRVASMLEVGTGFHPELTGRENVYLNGAILGMSKKEIDAKMEEIIDFSEVRQFIDTPVKRYSSGMYVKLAFSVAAHLDSEIMIMDEVLAVGDMAFQNKCIQKMREIADSGRTILYVSHNMSTITKLCDRCIVMNHGKIVYDGNVKTAIDLYMDSGSNTDCIKRIYTENDRTYKMHVDGVNLISARYLDKNSNLFKSSEKMKVEFVLEKNQKDMILGVRQEVRDSMRTPICTYLCWPLCKGDENGLITVDVEFDLGSLRPGTYYPIYTFYNKTEDGANFDADSVPGLGFTIESEGNEVIEWDARHWGCVEMPAPKVLAQKGNIL